MGPASLSRCRHERATPSAIDAHVGARILRAVADQIEELSWRGTLFDINGNSVGTYKLED